MSLRKPPKEKEDSLRTSGEGIKAARGSLCTQTPMERSLLLPTESVAVALEIKKKPAFGSLARFFLLSSLTLQTTAHVWLLRISRTQLPPPAEPSHHFYISATTVVLSELLKVFICLLISSWKRSFFKTLAFNGPLFLSFSVPSLLYSIQNNLLLVAVSNLPALTYQLTYQLKIATTAFFSAILLSRKISLSQWVAIFILLAGIAAVQYPSIGQGKDQKSPDSTVYGILLVLAACLLSGFAGVFFEKTTTAKKNDLSVWERSGILGVCSLLFSSVILLVSDGDSIARLGFFFGYNHLVWAIICLHVLGGFLVALVVDECGSVQKVISSSCSLVLTAVISEFSGVTSTNSLFTLSGTLLVVAGVVVFNW